MFDNVILTGSLPPPNIKSEGTPLFMKQPQFTVLSCNQTCGIDTGSHKVLMFKLGIRIDIISILSLKLFKQSKPLRLLKSFSRNYVTKKLMSSTRQWLPPPAPPPPPSPPHNDANFFFKMVWACPLNA